MMERAWVCEQIDREVERGNEPGAVRDLAALVIADMYLSGDLARITRGDDVRQYGRRYNPDVEHRTAQTGNDHKHLTKEQAEAWTASMVGADGSHGGRWKWNEIRQFASNWGIVGEGQMAEFYAVLNAMAADYGKVAQKYGVDNVDFYADMAKAFIHDADAVPDKVMVYYNNIAKHD